MAKFLIYYNEPTLNRPYKYRWYLYDQVYKPTDRPWNTRQVKTAINLTTLRYEVRNHWNVKDHYTKPPRANKKQVVLYMLKASVFPQ